jgi:PAS domain S-box-containing protein
MPIEDARPEVAAPLLLRAVVASGIAISFTDRDCRFQWANPAFTAITGYALEEILGKTPAIFRSSKHNDAFYETILSTIADGGVWRGEVTRVRKDGSLYVADLTVCPVFDACGKVAHFIDYHNDVTERKRMEVLMSERLGSMGLIAASIAHEINNPLAYVVGNTEVALESLESVSSRLVGRGLNEELRFVRDAVSALVEAREGALRISQVVRDMKLFSRGDEDTCARSTCTWRSSPPYSSRPTKSGIERASSETSVMRPCAVSRTNAA